MPWTNRADPRLPPVREFLACVIDIGRSMSALSETESRFLGAIHDRSFAAASRQREAAFQLMGHVQTRLRQLRPLAKAAGPAIEALAISQQTVAVITRPRGARTSRKFLARTFKKIGRPRSAVDAAWFLWSNAGWRRAFVKRGRLSRLCGVAATALLRGTRRDLASASRIIRTDVARRRQ
jgi:hypothetical protein